MKDGKIVVEKVTTTKKRRTATVKKVYEDGTKSESVDLVLFSPDLAYFNQPHEKKDT